MKKLVIVTDTYLPQVNGVVTSLQQLIEHLPKDEFEISVIHPGLFWTVPLFFYPEVRLSPLPYTTMWKLLVTAKADYIHIATEGPLGLSAKIICAQKKWKFTTSYHTHFSQYMKLRTGALFSTIYSYLSWFHNAGEVTMVGSESLKAELEEQGFLRLVVWPLGVDTTRFTRTDIPNPTALGLPNLAKPVFVYFGRIAIEKNIEEFLALTLPGTKLVIGEGPLAEAMREKYSDSVFFTGYKMGDELINWLSLCDVFVFPSRTETFGLVVLEALSLGIPVAAHNATGPKDIISQGVDGYIDEDLQQAALACLKLSSEKCREKAIQFSWDTSAQSFTKNLAETGFYNSDTASQTP